MPADSLEEVEVFGFDHNKDHVLVYGRTLLQDEAKCSQTSELAGLTSPLSNMLRLQCLSTGASASGCVQIPFWHRVPLVCWRWLRPAEAAQGAHKK